MVRYELLGQLRVVDVKGSYSLSSQRMEVLLATLVIMPGRVVSMDQLITEIWPSDPPRRAVASLHVYVSQLRKFLARLGGSNPIVTRAPGYLFQPDDAETDLDDFQDLVTEGREHIRHDRHVAAVTCLQSALRLWRGTPFSDLREGSIIRSFGEWLDQVRLECVKMLIASSLQLGRHGEVSPFLYSLVAEHPLHETFYHQLMTALYHSGRRAEALKVYQMARNTLRDELGLEPCLALRELQHSILTAEKIAIPDIPDIAQLPVLRLPAAVTHR